MGVSIHYKGQLNSRELIEPFFLEIEDIIRSMEWEYESFEKDSGDPVPVKGFFITPHPDSEPFTLFVDEDGALRNPIMLQVADNEHSLLNHVKTQFAPLDNHIAIIKLFRYLKQKYISNLVVVDEGLYWETSDEAVLKEQFEKIWRAMLMMENILKSVSVEKGDTAESISGKLEKILKSRFNKKS